MTVTKAIARCWTDADYKAKLLSDPHAALAEVGVEVPAGNTVKVMENTADTHHLVLPVSPPAAGELSSEELEKIAGGSPDMTHRRVVHGDVLPRLEPLIEG